MGLDFKGTGEIYHRRNCVSADTARYGKIYSNTTIYFWEARKRASQRYGPMHDWIMKNETDIDRSVLPFIRKHGI